MMAVLKCGSAYFCIGPILVFVGSVSLCAICFSIVLPHRATINWVKRNCTVTGNGSFNTDHCSCERHEQLDLGWCSLRFPCLRIYVTYKDDDNKTMSSILFRNWSDAFYQNVRTIMYILLCECSLHDCSASEWNIRQSSKFNGMYGHAHQRVTCFVDPVPEPGKPRGFRGRGVNNPPSVIMNRTSGRVVLHSLLWPTLCLTVGSCIWIALCCGCWTIQPTPSDAYRIHAYGVTTRENVLLH